MIDLSENTNRWGMPLAAKRVLAEANLTSGYPEMDALSLRRALSAHLGVEVDCVICGCGSDDVLGAALGALAAPGDRIAIPEPTFRMVPVFARASRLELALIPPGSDLTLDVDATLATRPRVVYVCSPNNPTGLAVPRREIQRLLEESSATVIVDEAYVDFDGATVLDLIGRHERLLVVRTFSKAFGLAALRVGYGVGSPGIIADIAAVRGPFQVNTLASRAAIAALQHDLPWVRETAAGAVASREMLIREIAALGLETYRSRANFVLVRVGNAAAAAEAMRVQGVVVRAFADLPGVGDAIRITVGPGAEMEVALRALAAAVKREAIGRGACV
jgi:histidinol-phosphate aminotransferase